MNLVTLECPLCRGMIQVDVAAAGQHVACPLCQGTMQVPPLAAIAAAAPAPPAPPPPPPPPGRNLPPMPVMLMAVSCPGCGGAFQVPPGTAGMQLPCPTCQRLVTIPEPSAAAGSEAPETSAPPAVDAAAAAVEDVSALLPPGASAAPGAPGEQVALPQAPRPILVPPSQSPEGNGLALRDRPKILGEGADEIEVKRLSPAEKARRRTIRNVVLFVLGLAGLLAIGIYMARR